MVVFSLRGLTMKTSLHSNIFAFVSALILALLWLPTQAEAGPWSDKKLDKTILKIDHDLTRKKWASAISRSSKAIPQCIAKYSDQHKMCIVMLRNINHSYEETRRFNPNHEQIKSAYVLSSHVFGKIHSTTIKTRDYY